MKKHAAPIIAAVLLRLPVLYVGSYLALVTPDNVTDYKSSKGGRFNFANNYRIGSEWCDRIFWPLEQIDRKLRPKAWELDRDDILHRAIN
jgi:hypothetical protein